MEEAEQCDRLSVMVAGKVEAEGTVQDVIAGRTVVEVHSDDWQRAFSTLDDHGYAVQAHGDVLRVPAPPRAASAVTGLLEHEGMTATAEVRPASLDEAFISILSDSREHDPRSTAEETNGTGPSTTTSTTPPVMKGKIHPTVSRTFPLDLVAHAVEDVHRNRHQGKVGILALAPSRGSGVDAPEFRSRHEAAINRLRFRSVMGATGDNPRRTNGRDHQGQRSPR